MSETEPTFKETRPSSPGHPYPLKIGAQTRRFMQGALFYIAFINEATSTFMQMPGSMQEMRSVFASYGYTDETWDTSWLCLEEYFTAFSDPASRHAMISIKSHWDWYVTHLGRFIRYENDSTGDPPISPALIEDLDMIGFKSIAKQIDILRKTTRLNFDIPQDQIDNLAEMTLVRNLGIHSQWEVDATYLKWSKNTQYKLGEQRLFTPQELNDWYRILVGLIDKISSMIAKKYDQAPGFSEL